MLLSGPVSHTSIQYIYFVEIFNVSLDLSTNYLAHFTVYFLKLLLYPGML